MANKREAGPLADQIQLIEHCSALVHGKVSKLPRPELQTHLHAIASSDISLPFDLRCQLLERRSVDCAEDIVAAKKKEDMMKAVKSLVGCLTVWMPADSTCDDSKVEARNIWASAVSSIRSSVQKGLKSEEEGKADLEMFAQDWLGFGNGEA